MVFLLVSFPPAHPLFHRQQPSISFHRHIPYSIGCSLHTFLHRYTPLSATVSKPSSIGIGNNTFDFIGNIPNQIHTLPPLKTNLFSLAINSHGNLSLANQPFLIILTRTKNGVNTCPPISEYKISMLRNLLQLMLAIIHSFDPFSKHNMICYQT
jgi:hypothetical protein